MYSMLAPISKQRSLRCTTASSIKLEVLTLFQVNGGDTLLSKFVESLAVDKLPYFHFYRGGDLILHFAANLSKLNTLRAEIAAQKECVIRSILEPQFLSQPAEDTTQLE